MTDRANDGRRDVPDELLAARQWRRQIRERRHVSRQLDRLLGLDRYPDVALLYGVRSLIGEDPPSGRNPAA